MVESPAGLLSDDTVVAARAAAIEAGMTDQPILTYLANEIRFGDRVTPYSLVTAFDLAALGLDDAALGGASTDPPSIVLNGPPRLVGRILASQIRVIADTTELEPRERPYDVELSVRFIDLSLVELLLVSVKTISPPTVGVQVNPVAEKDNE